MEEGVEFYVFNPPAVALLDWWARAGIGVGTRKGYPESFCPILQSISQSIQLFRLGLDFVNENL